MKKLLDNYTKNIPIYAYERDFCKVPILFHQISVIQALEEKKMDIAKFHWEHLKTISPSDFQHDFIYSGTKCIFSLCLGKHLTLAKNQSELVLAQGLNKLDALLALLEMAKAPLHAELIFEKIWGRSIESKEDLIKVSRLVYTAKQKKKVDIRYHKGTFELLKIKSKKAS
jgi:hypothetical protein